MPNYKVVDADRLDSDLEMVADAIRAKGGTSEKLAFPEGYKAAVESMQAGSGRVNVPAKAVNFRDYDGTVLYSYTAQEAAALTELPPLPTHSGLICQGWNWALVDIKAMGGTVEVGAMYITDDSKTRIYITLNEGRTSPMLGCCPNGTVIVDWGDGSAPEVLTGTSTSTVVWTQTHEYTKPGDYTIELTVDGTVGFYGYVSSKLGSCILRHTNGEDARNSAYRNAVKKIEFGGGITSLGPYALYRCAGITAVTIPDRVTSIGEYALGMCENLTSVTIPNRVTSIGDHAISGGSLTAVTIPNSVTSIGEYAFASCPILAAVTLPNSITSIGNYVFSVCYGLTVVTIPNRVTSISSDMFANCENLTAVTIPNSVRSIGNYAFYSCYAMRYYDFTKHTAVPQLSHISAFVGIAADCEIRVPAALASAWKAATNWSSYASQIVGV